MVAGPAVENLEVHIRASALCEALEEVGQQLGLEIADPGDLEAKVDHRMRASAEIDGCNTQCFVHRHHEISRAIDPALRPECRRDRFSQRDPEILDGVMLVDVEVTECRHLQVECAVPGGQFQHVIEKADAGLDAVSAAAVEVQPNGNRGLLCLSVYDSSPHRTSSSAAIHACVCSTTP